MSASPPSPLPAHLRPIPVEIPATWTPEQALAVFELLDEKSKTKSGLATGVDCKV